MPNIYLVVAWERWSRQRKLIYDIVGLSLIGPKIVDSDFHINFVVVVSGNDLKLKAPSSIVIRETILATSNPQGPINVDYCVMTIIGIVIELPEQSMLALTYSN